VKTASVMVVDDDSLGAESLVALLQRQGYHAEWCANGESAISKLPAVRCDLLIIDEYMPGIGGVETVRRLREHPQYRHLPVLLLTAAAGEALAGLAAEMTDLSPAQVLQKPAEFEHVLSVGQSLLDVSRALKQAEGG
jgi:CheY-like chemotaxis protein